VSQRLFDALEDGPQQFLEIEFGKEGVIEIQH
jgi:hypothetical protein